MGCSRFEASETAPPIPELPRILASLGDALGADASRLVIDPTVDEAADAIRRFLDQETPGPPFAMVVLSGRGRVGSDGELRLAMRDTNDADPDRTSLPVLDVLAWAAKVEQPVLVVVDTSFSGLALRAARRVGVPGMGRRGRAGKQLAIWTSSGEAEHSVGELFLSTLTLALSGGVHSRPEDGGIDIQELHDDVLQQLGTLKSAAPVQEPQLLVLGDPATFTFPLGRPAPPGQGESEPLPGSPVGLHGREPSPEQAELSPEQAAPESPESGYDLDPDSELLMAWADAVRRGAGRDRGEPLDVVLGGLAGAPATVKSATVPYLRDVLESLGTADRPYEQVLREARERFGPPDGIEPDFLDHGDLLRHRPVLDLARSIAGQTLGTPHIGVSHLLAAALTTTELPSPLVTLLGADRADLCARLLDATARDTSAGDPQAWARILGPAELVSPFASDYVPARTRRRGEEAPPPLPDHLDVDAYVTMLAAMIARRSTAMPVSIGLFGEWGSGKSYFMELLRQKVDQLSTTPTTGAVYCQEVIQVTFNAWSYADTNLWASLAADFFTQLATPDTDPDDARRARIEESLKEKNQLRQELRTARESAEKRTAQVQADYAEAIAKRESSSRKLTARLTAAVVADPEVERSISRLASVLGRDETKPDQVRQVLQIARDVQGITSDLAATRRVLAERSLLVPFILLLVVVFAVSVVALLPDGQWPWLQWLTSGGALAGVLAFLSSLGVLVSTSRRAVAGLREMAQAADRARESARTAHDATLKHLESALRQAEVEEARARAELQELDATIAQLDKELADYEPGRRLYQFIAERAASLDYRGQLGVVSLVRRDFEQLVELMHRWRTAPPSAPDTPRPIDRIVLYIDDLDRCEPEQVVQVLQAVHLLLAMDLFVVVVGVDPRWLLRALRTRYAGILDVDRGRADGGDAGFETSTPQDYLEKIFQVPFVLPPMTDAGFKDLVTSFVRGGGEVHQASGTIAVRSAVSGSPSVIRAANGRADGPPAANGEAFKVEAGSQIAPSLASAASAPPGSLAPITSTPVTTRELDLLGALAPLVRTPRAATRMFNIYGLLRSAKDLTPGGTFLGTPDRPGDYQAVIQLLGILTARPQLLGTILWGGPDDDPMSTRGLCRTQGPGSWQQFVASLEPMPGQSGSWSNGVTTRIGADEVGLWHSLVATLLAIGAMVNLDDIERYRLWGPQVARFSFQLSAFADPE